jgi:tetratricopeptide (TPR) repeat protein
MKKAATLLTILIFSGAMAQKPTTLEQAKALASQSKKPILLEFFEPDCEYCQMAIHDFASNDTILTILKSVVYLPFDVNTDEGDRISKSYYVANTFPVFVLADSAADIIYYWQGYFTVSQFLPLFNQGFANRITIKERYKELSSTPSLDNILFLAKYNTDIGENLKAADLYRQAQELQNTPNYIYKIFENMADAVWKGKSTFDQLKVAADNVLANKSGDVSAVANVGIITARVARKVGRTDDIAKYLQAGLNITENQKDPKSAEWHATLLSDQALYVKKDTSEALSIKKKAMGVGWEARPNKAYGFARWCSERKINLVEAEKYAKMASEQAPPGKIKAPILTTLADIYEARGKKNEAIKTLELAAKEDPHNNWYATKIEEIRTGQTGNK